MWKFYKKDRLLYNKYETKIKNMKIKCRVRPLFAFIDAINSLSWFPAAISITLLGLSVLWGLGTFFIMIST